MQGDTHKLLVALSAQILEIVCILSRSTGLNLYICLAVMQKMAMVVMMRSVDSVIRTVSHGISG